MPISLFPRIKCPSALILRVLGTLRMKRSSSDERGSIAMEREDMADKGDTVFFAGYGSVIIILGLVIFMYSMSLFDAMFAFGFWLLFTSFVLIGLGTVRTRDAPSGSPILIGAGVFFTLVSVTW